jgi:hypothetical protein
MIMIKFVKGCRPTTDILNEVDLYDNSPELYYTEKTFHSPQELDDYLRFLNLHPCVQLAWIRQYTV